MTESDPYERKRRAARQVRQGKLDRIATSGIPIDGDPVAIRRPVQQIGSLFDSVLESVKRDMYKDEAKFFDTLREQWDAVFPNCPAKPGRWQEGKLVLYVTNAGQSFALRPKLPAMKKKILAIEGAPKGRFVLLVEIHGKTA